MSKDNSESFEEWFKKTFPSVYTNNPYEARAKSAWNHQQKKIDELEKTICYQEGVLDKQEQKLQALEEDIKFLLAFAPKDEPPIGLDPTFYFTLSLEGDVAIHERVAKIKKALEKTKRGKDDQR